MPAKQELASFAGKLGTRLSQAHAETVGKPIDLGGRKQLPPDVKDGVAKLSTMYTKTSEKDDGVCPKGEVFFRGSAVVLWPKECANAITQIIIPLCDVPAKGNAKERSFNDNWNKFRSLFEALGVAPFPEPPIDPEKDQAGAVAQGARIEKYFFSAMTALVQPERLRNNPIYIHFTTRGWKSPKKAGESDADYEKREPMVFEDWHGLATKEQTAALFDGNGRPNPAAGVTQVAPPPPPSHSAPPSQVAPAPSSNGQHDSMADYIDAISSYIEVAMNDPHGATAEGTEAIEHLERLAMEAGWTPEQVTAASDWAAVGDMALNPPTAATQPAQAPASDPTVGSKWMFCKRGVGGNKLKDSSGKEFPPQEVEVTSVDTAAKTCTVKTVKGNKDVMDVATKKPMAVKFEWLEQSLPY